jgi:hypothetical protein
MAPFRRSGFNIGSLAYGGNYGRLSIHNEMLTKEKYVTWSR